MENEDLGKEEVVTPETPEATPEKPVEKETEAKPVEEEPKKEETPNPETETETKDEPSEKKEGDAEVDDTTETPEMDDFADLDALIDNVLAAEKKEEKIVEPSNFPEKETEPAEEEKPKAEDEEISKEDQVTREEMTELDEAFNELEGKFDAQTKELSEANEINTKQSTLNDGYEEALEKLGKHPILGPLNEKLLKGEDLDIPELLKNFVEDDLASLPNLDGANNEPGDITPKLSVQDRIANRAKQLY